MWMNMLVKDRKGVRSKLAASQGREASRELPGCLCKGLCCSAFSCTIWRRARALRERFAAEATLLRGRNYKEKEL